MITGLFGHNAAWQIMLEKPTYLPGEEIHLTVGLHVARNLQIQEARVELVCARRYDVCHDSGHGMHRSVKHDDMVVESQSLLPRGTLREGDDSAYHVTFHVPAQGPPTAAAPPLSIAWAVRAILDIPHAPDARAETPVTILSPHDTYARWVEGGPAHCSQDCPMAFTLSNRTLRAGEMCSGTLTVAPETETETQGMRVELIRHTEIFQSDSPTRDVATTVIIAEPDLLAACAPQEFPFILTVPADACPSLETDQFSVHWFLRGVVDRFLQIDYAVEQEVTIYNG